MNDATTASAGEPEPQGVAARRLADARLPQDLVIDTRDAARRGIRLTLNSRQLTLPLGLPDGVDCLGGLDDAAIRELEYAVVDVETTGGSFGRGHRITEIAAVRMRGDGTRVDEFRTLVNPERPIPTMISSLTNITWEMVCEAPRFPDVARDVARVIGGAVFVAHNAAFDWRFVTAELGRSGVPLTGSTLCTVHLARKLVPEIRSRSLDALSYFFDIRNEARHRAYGDARATAVLLDRLLGRLDDLEVTRWHELQELLRRRAKRRKKRANPHSMPESPL